MERRIFHGNVTADELARVLTAQFNRGNLRTQRAGNGDQIAIQIGTNSAPQSGGQTALTVLLQNVEDGVMVNVGQQQWFGVAASLGYTALSALRNPLTLLNRLDDLAQDFESLQLDDEVWKAIDAHCRAQGASFELSSRLRRSVCDFCNTPNPIGEPSCLACGAPLGGIQPATCKNCGFVVQTQERYCPNCGKPLV